MNICHYDTISLKVYSVFNITEQNIYDKDMKDIFLAIKSAIYFRRVVSLENGINGMLV